MLGGMAYELERQWRSDTEAITARDAEQRRVAMETESARRAGGSRRERPRLLDRVLASVQTLAGLHPAA